MKDYKTRVDRLHKQDAKYLRLSAKGLCMWTEWELPGGKVVHLDLHSKAEEEIIKGVK